MTVQTTSNKAGPYAGNGVTVTWGTTFRVDQASDLQVILTDGAGVETTLNPVQYAVSGWSDTAGVTVTYPLSGTPLGPTQKITLLRLVGYDQQTSITNQGGFYPKVIEAALDRIVYQCQQLAEKLGRAVTVNVSSTQDPAAVFNSIATNAAAAANNASQAVATWTTFHNQYLGAFTSDPAIDNSGNPLQQGALYWNTTNSKMRIYGGIGWQDTAVATPANFSANIFSGTGAQTAFTLSSVPPNLNSILVSINGVTQRPATDYTLSGTTLNFVSAPPAGTNNIMALVASSLSVGVPSDGSVTPPKIDPSVALAVGGDIGQCYLSLSGGNLKLSPYNGRLIMISGVLYAIPVAGVTISAVGLAASTTYYAYAYGNAGTVALELSTTVPVMDSNGIMIKTGDGSRTLVGMVRTTAATAFADTPAQRFVISWFNRRPKELRNAFTVNRAITSTVTVEVNTEIRAEFLVWATDVAVLGANVTMFSSVAASDNVGIGIDGSSYEEVAVITPANNNFSFSTRIEVSKSGLAEGYHYLTLLASVQASTTGTFYGATQGSPRCITTGHVLG